MSADNRSTHTDALATLGTIIDINKEKRDAIHLGVEPIIAGCNLNPGDDVGIHNGYAYIPGNVYVPDDVKPFKPVTVRAVGIVDPFLTQPVEAGQAFWLIVYPRQITSLRHVWEHPDFKDSQETGGKELLQETPMPAPTAEQLRKTKILIGDPVAIAEQALIDTAERLDVEYDDLMNHARDATTGSYWVHEEDGGKFEGESVGKDFWKNYNLVKGTSEPDHGNFLSCSC